MKLLSTFVALFLAIFVVAVPSSPSVQYAHLSKRNLPCNGTKPTLALPESGGNLTGPDGAVSFVLLGVGFQNYTCDGEKYTPAGALAQLYDLSCLSEKEPEFFNSSQDAAFQLFSDFSSLDGYSHFVSKKIGDHFFQSAENGTVPVWDFRGASTPDQPNAFVIGSKVGGIKAPTGPGDVDWLQLKGVNGDLATAIYRTDTRGGQPPTTPCNANGATTHEAKYVSKYWLYGSKVSIPATAA